jgi:rubrerythrin
MKMSRKRGRSRVEEVQEEKQQQESAPIVWTHCPKCGDTWTVQTVLVPGKCRICGGKPKIQEVVF